MLTDTALRNLKPKSLTYKVSDRDGMYVTVSPANTVTFRYDYRLNGRRETLTIGRYGPGGISLATARELLLNRPGSTRHSRAAGSDVFRTLSGIPPRMYCGVVWGCRTSRCS